MFHGLADVCGSLPVALAAHGHRVMVVSPRYIHGTSEDDKYSGAVDLDCCVKLYCFGGAQQVGFFHEFRQGVDWVFVDHPSFHRPGNPYGDKYGTFGDNQLLKPHWCFIWEGSLMGRIVYSLSMIGMPAWFQYFWALAAKYRPHGVYKDARSILVIHNIAHQALRYAIQTYSEYESSWEGLMKRGMARDYTWGNAATQYEQVIEWAFIDPPYC